MQKSNAHIQISKLSENNYKLHAKNTNLLTDSGFMLHRFFETTWPAIENRRSELTDVALTHKYLRASLETAGNEEQWPPHHSRGSVSMLKPCSNSTADKYDFTSLAALFWGS